ncbi:MAG: hypothetical protein ACJ72A_23490 [Nocardioidaceae bacterium]
MTTPHPARVRCPWSLAVLAGTAAQRHGRRRPLGTERSGAEPGLDLVG